MRRWLVLLIGPLVLLVAACEVFQFSLSVDRVAEIQGAGVTLKGKVTCTDPEPIRLFVTIQQGTLSQSDGTEINCLGDNAWQNGFVFNRPFQAGEATVTVNASTRPEHVQDAVQVTRKVLLLPPGS